MRIQPLSSPYQGPVAAEILLVLPCVLGVAVLQVLAQVVRGDVPAAAGTLAPPPVGSCLSQDENLLSSQKTELEGMHRREHSRKICSCPFNCSLVTNPRPWAQSQQLHASHRVRAMRPGLGGRLATWGKAHLNWLFLKKHLLVAQDRISPQPLHRHSDTW